MAALLKVPVSNKDHIQGNNNARITLVEYGDFQCPYCGQAYPIIKRVQEHFGSQLRFVFRNFPLTEIHQFAEMAAETAEFAAKHNRFWEMHDLLFENQANLGQDLLVELTQKLQLPVPDLMNSLQSSTFEEKIKQDFLGGVRSGVNGTPAFYINNVRFDESYDYDNLVLAIQRAQNV